MDKRDLAGFRETQPGVVINTQTESLAVVRAAREKAKRLSDLEDAVRRLEARVAELERAQALPGPMIAEGVNK